MDTDTATVQMLLPDLMPEGQLRDVPLHDLTCGVGPAPSKALCDSVRALGILQPIIVEEARDGSLHVLDGRRRVLAAFAADLLTAPALVVSAGSVSPQVVQLASHAIRSRNRAAEADAIEDLITGGATAHEIAQAVGLTVQEVRAVLPLTELSPTLREALRDGKITATMATEIAKLPGAAQDRLTDRYIKAGRISAMDVREQRLARTQQAAAAMNFDGMAAAVPDAPAGMVTEVGLIEDDPGAAEASANGLPAADVPITRWGVLAQGLRRVLKESKTKADLVSAIEREIAYYEEMNAQGAQCLPWPR